MEDEPAHVRRGRSPYALAKEALGGPEALSRVIQSLRSTNLELDLSEDAYEEANEDFENFLSQGLSQDHVDSLTGLRIGAMTLSWELDRIVSPGYLPRAFVEDASTPTTKKNIVLDIKDRMVTYPSSADLE